MAPRSKRPRTATPEEEEEEEEQVEERQQGASHLVSFLTGFADHHVDDDLPPLLDHNGDAIDDFSASDEDEEPEEEPDEADVEPDDDGVHTPSRKTGLVGVATPSRSTRGTPKKRKAPGSATPRKTPKRPVNGEETADEGIIRKSTADAYFTLMKASRTSGNSYSLLADPLSARAYEKYIAESSAVRGRISPPEAHRGRFRTWSKELEAGFNLLFYGFGSKRPTLNLFAQEELAKKGHVVVINGTFPGLGVRDIVSEIEDRLGVPQAISVPPSCSTPLERAAHRIYAHFLPPSAISDPSEWPTANAPLYLVIHNIDAPALRSPKSLAILSLLASCPRIHLIASYDHVHTPLIFSSSLSNTPPHHYTPGSWSGTPLSSRGFYWVNHSLTTYAPYDLELSYLRMSAQTLTPSTSGPAGGVSEEGTLQILKSVPHLSARLLKLLFTLQLSRLPADSKWHVAYPASASAPPFAVDGNLLKKLAKDKWIAGEGERFEAFLGEYRDHGLVVEAAQARGGEDGEEEGREGRWLWVPLGKAAVERVLESMVGVE
ncbi:hypothetical protein L202_05957 [Cryptococcus amylolentus CBS 6039]|uniref:Origin recognition complex subunit 2 n=1 Tax=Cryptococcus amylolentus CBS 6039 TaxID=1295533 RepID=A0A1E3HKL2_9TREE|nr:hypothetical protein L202_05957 [Cryptococcus amylolentus CBS 6039]ODN75991.1 hypothetical protein L202_05957 [Cryptococcus amylolentus CBS 6039]